MPLSYTIILGLCGFTLSTLIMFLSLRIFRVPYTTRQFIFLMVYTLILNIAETIILYTEYTKVEDWPLSLIIFSVLLELGLLYVIFRILKIAITIPKYIGIMMIQCLYSIGIGALSACFSVFIFHGQSMIPTYHDGDILLVNKIAYFYNAPKYGDIVVIEAPTDLNSLKYIKRTIGTPGDILRFEDGKVSMKTAGSKEFRELQEPFLSEANVGKTYLPDYIEKRTFIIADNSYWVMGDNRQNSADSRQCFQNCFGKNDEAHFVSRERIMGKVIWQF